jgi:hypothetical protein
LDGFKLKTVDRLIKTVYSGNKRSSFNIYSTLESLKIF